ncbi:MAG TPA: hypothetical protein VIK40_02335 [Geomonas sp.]
MKKSVFVLFATTVLLLGYSLPGQAHLRGGVWIGPVWGPGWWGAPYGYPNPYYTSSPPVVIRQEPQEYIHQPAPQTEQQYWYYCAEPQGYYPYVKKCPNGWMRVVPTPAAPPEPESKE